MKCERIDCNNCLNFGTRFCSMTCAAIVNNVSRRDRALELWKQGKIELNEERCKSFLIIERGKQCERCRWHETNIYSNTIPIELEHKDGNCYNNKYENVELLCPNCHSLTPTYRRLNIGKGVGRKKFNGEIGRVD